MANKTRKNLVTTPCPFSATASIESEASSPIYSSGLSISPLHCPALHLICHGTCAPNTFAVLYARVTIQNELSSNAFLNINRLNRAMSVMIRPRSFNELLLNVIHLIELIPNPKWALSIGINKHKDHHERANLLVKLQIVNSLPQIEHG